MAHRYYPALYISPSIITIHCQLTRLITLLENNWVTWRRGVLVSFHTRTRLLPRKAAVSSPIVVLYDQAAMQKKDRDRTISPQLR